MSIKIGINGFGSVPLIPTNSMLLFVIPARRNMPILGA